MRPSFCNHEFIKKLIMKKVSILTLALTTTLAVFAQDTTTTTTTTTMDMGQGTVTGQAGTPRLRTPMAVQTRFGLKGGVNLTTHGAKEFTNRNFNANNKTTYYFGGFVNIPLSAAARLQPELVLSGQGSKIEETTTTGTSRTYNYEEDLTYINLPIMFQVQTAGGFFVETGPQFSYLIDAKQEGTSPISTTESTDRDYYYDNLDIAWGIGVGYLSRVGLGINARYNLGIRNIVNENATTGDVGELRNLGLQIGLVYQFGAHK
jgi:hypothetical protein